MSEERKQWRVRSGEDPFDIEVISPAGEDVIKTGLVQEVRFAVTAEKGVRELVVVVTDGLGQVDANVDEVRFDRLNKLVASAGYVLAMPGIGIPPDPVTRAGVLAEVAEERRRQDRKWGVQDHNLSDYYVILAEEVGEAAKAIVEFNAARTARGMQMFAAEARKELLEVAAVAVAMAERIDRMYPEGEAEER